MMYWQRLEKYEQANQRWRSELKSVCMCGGGGRGLKIKLVIPGRAVFDFERSTLLYLIH